MFEFVFSAAVDADCLPSEIKSAEAATGAVADCCFASEQDCLERPVRHLFHELSDLALVAVDAVGLKKDKIFTKMTWFLFIDE